MQEWITNEHVDANVLQAIKSGVIDTGRELARSYGGHAQPIACAVTEGSSLIGGATGRTEFNRLFIDYLWIAPHWRLRGLASEALHKIEALAAQRGCIDAIIETLDDDIAQWYQRGGLCTHRPSGWLLRPVEPTHIAQTTHPLQAQWHR